MSRCLLVLWLTGLITVGCNRNQNSNAELDPDIARFVAAKREQTRLTPAAQKGKLPDDVWKFFDAAERNDRSQVTNLSATLELQARRYSTPGAAPGLLGQVWQGVLEGVGFRPGYAPGLNTEAWPPVHEVIGITGVYREWDHKWMRRFGQDIIGSIPSNSIYFGGTDAGRFIVTALSESHAAGRPFFTITQNALADNAYLSYLQLMYGRQIRIPSQNDSQQAFQDYLQDAQDRKTEGKLKPGEDVQIVQGRVQISGEVAVMEINARIVYNIFTNNADREFYIEESFPLDWMYPYLSPHGLILKLNRKPLAKLSNEIVQRDHEYWTRYTKELIGDWLKPETSFEAVLAFSEKIYLKRDLDGFTGDADYVRNEAAQKSYAKLRSAIAGVYAWRAVQAQSAAPVAPMNREAEFAFKQSLALGPILPDPAGKYVNLLVTQGRIKEAMQVAEALKSFAPKDTYSKQLIEYVQSVQAYLSTNQPSIKQSPN